MSRKFRPFWKDWSWPKFRRIFDWEDGETFTTQCGITVLIGMGLALLGTIPAAIVTAGNMGIVDTGDLVGFFPFFFAGLIVLIGLVFLPIAFWLRRLYLYMTEEVADA